MEQVIIRQLEKRDASQVALLIVQLTKNIVEPEKLEERIKMLVEPGNWQYFVAQVDEKVVAFGGLAWYPIPSKGLQGWYEEFVVDKDYQHRGIGSAIQKRVDLLAESKKIVQVKLTTPNAQPFYTKNGFAEKKETLMIKRYYERLV